MQTFLPYPDFAESARVLDRQRLGKQRVECKQILMALTNPVAGWKHHPATKMWRGYESSLCDYASAVCIEWLTRGYQDSLLEYFRVARAHLPEHGDPHWLGEAQLHTSHRSNLLRKMPEHYRQFWPSDPDDIPYWWPV